MRLYLIRHAQSGNNEIWNGTDHVEGRSPDPDITAIGHQQSQLLAEHLVHPTSEPRQHPFIESDAQHYGLTHIYCSLMARSIMTAGHIAQATNLELHALPDIFEKYGIYEVCSNGDLQGLPGPGRAHFENRFPDLKLPSTLNDSGWWSRPIETEEEFVDRVKTVVSDIKRTHADTDACIAMVAHGDFIDQFVNELMGIQRHKHNYDSDWVANWSFHNTSISRIDFVNKSHTVVYLNRIDHLPPELVTW